MQTIVTISVILLLAGFIILTIYMYVNSTISQIRQIWRSRNDKSMPKRPSKPTPKHETPEYRMPGQLGVYVFWILYDAIERGEEYIEECAKYHIDRFNLTLDIEKLEEEKIKQGEIQVNKLAGNNDIKKLSNDELRMLDCPYCELGLLVNIKGKYYCGDCHKEIMPELIETLRNKKKQKIIKQTIDYVADHVDRNNPNFEELVNNNTSSAYSNAVANALNQKKASEQKRATRLNAIVNQQRPYPLPPPPPGRTIGGKRKVIRVKITGMDNHITLQYSENGIKSDIKITGTDNTSTYQIDGDVDIKITGMNNSVSVDNLLNIVAQKDTGMSNRINIL